MRPGKLDPALLDALLQTLPQALSETAASHDAQLTFGPGLGRDAAAVRLPDRYLVLAADPISFTTTRGGASSPEGAASRLGAAAVHVNANDVVCLGADPRWFLASILVPPDTSETDVTEAEITALFHGLQSACREVGAVLVGGHTEISDAVTRPLVAGTMIGDTPLGRLYLSTALRPGDALIQIGPVAIEGTALLASEAPGALRAAGLPPAQIAQAAALALPSDAGPGISVVPFAHAVWGAPGLHSLHDPTEGGIATACREMAQAGGLAVEVDDPALLVHPLTARVAQALDIDWRGLLASGTLLAAVNPAHADAFLRRLDRAGHPAARIGRFTAAPGPHQETAILRSPQGPRALPRFARDEALRVLTPDA